MEADNATMLQEGVGLALRRVLFIRPHFIFILRRWSLFARKSLLRHLQKECTLLTVVLRYPSASFLKHPKVDVTGENARLIEITQGNTTTRIVRTAVYDCDYFFGVESDGDFTSATMEDNEVIEAGAFNASFIRYRDKSIHGDGFLAYPSRH